MKDDNDYSVFMFLALMPIWLGFLFVVVMAILKYLGLVDFS